MMLVYEKKVLSFEDTKERLEHFIQAKWKDYVNNHLNEYKKQINLDYKPNIYLIITQSLGKYRLYIIAVSARQATTYALEQGYEVRNIEVIPNYEEWGEPGDTQTTKEVINKVNEIPSILGAT